MKFVGMFSLAIVIAMVVTANDELKTDVGKPTKIPVEISKYKFRSLSDSLSIVDQDWLKDNSFLVVFATKTGKHVIEIWGVTADGLPTDIMKKTIIVGSDEPKPVPPQPNNKIDQKLLDILNPLYGQEIQPAKSQSIFILMELYKQLSLSANDPQVILVRDLVTIGSNSTKALLGDFAIIKVREAIRSYMNEKLKDIKPNDQLTNDRRKFFAELFETISNTLGEVK